MVGLGSMLRFALALSVSLAASTQAADLVLKPGQLEAVLDQARKAPKPVRIIVEDGVHPLTETIALGKDDSQVTWSGKNAVFMAGKAITGWQQAEGGLWKAALPDKAWKFEQLWINGRRATLARSPNKGFFHITDQGALAEHELPRVLHREGAVRDAEGDPADGA